MPKGVFTILDSYSGKQDSFLSANALLKEKIKAHDGNIFKLLNTHNLATISKFQPHVAVAFEYIKKSKDGGGAVKLFNNTTNNISFSMDGNNGSWINDQVVRVVIGKIGEATGSTLRYRYCDLPGIRLFERVALNIENVDISEYTSDDISFFEFHVDKEQHQGFVRSLGREESRKGYFYIQDSQVVQEITFKDGAQTLKSQQNEIELWIPLFFWYNKSVGQSLINSKMLTSQYKINITLAPLDKIIQTVDENNNIIPNSFNELSLKSVELYSKNIYTIDEVHNLLINKPLVTPIRIIKKHAEILDHDEGNIILDQLRYSIEYLKFGFKPVENESSFDDWYKFSKIVKKELPRVTTINNPLIVPVQQLVIRTAYFDEEDYVIDKVGFNLFGNVVYPLLPASFYNNYIPLVSPYLTTPRDKGKMLANFCLSPGNPELTGYLNNSVGREFYLKYTGRGNISEVNKVKLYVCAEVFVMLYYDTFTLKTVYIT